MSDHIRLQKDTKIHELTCTSTRPGVAIVRFRGNDKSWEKIMAVTQLPHSLSFYSCLNRFIVLVYRKAICAV